MPVFRELIEPYLQLFPEQVHRVGGIVPENLLHIKELRLVVDNYAGIGRNGNLAVGKGVEGIYRLVRGHVVGQMDDDVGLVGGKVIDFPDLDLPFVLGFHYGVYHEPGGLPVRDFRDGYGVLVELLDFRTYLDGAAPPAFAISGAVCKTSGREVRQQLEILALEYGNGCVHQLVEVMGQYLG